MDSRVEGYIDSVLEYVVTQFDQNCISKPERLDSEDILALYDQTIVESYISKC